jgi:FKBP-type peptidyl-prolyl cis-trans isomerase
VKNEFMVQKADLYASGGLKAGLGKKIAIKYNGQLVSGKKYPADTQQGMKILGF